MCTSGTPPEENVQSTTTAIDATKVGLACETSSRLCARNASCACPYCNLASTPGHSQTLSHSCGENSGEGLVPTLCHEPEMVDSVS